MVNVMDDVKKYGVVNLAKKWFCANRGDCPTPDDDCDKCQYVFKAKTDCHPIEGCPMNCEGCMNDVIDSVLEWCTVLEVPIYLIQSIGDSGNHETFDVKSGELIDKDDLRISFMLSGGHELLIPGGSRIVIEGTIVCVQTKQCN